MEKLEEFSELPKNVSLILGFFDGVHLGHKKVVKSAVDYAKQNNAKSLLITFKNSPAEYFKNKKSVDYIYSRDYNYELIKNLAVDYLLENDFEDFVSITAEDYLANYLIKNFCPISISTGFNHTFGKNKIGNSDYLGKMQDKYGYKYLKTCELSLNKEVISSTIIKKYLNNGEIVLANSFLGEPFTIKSVVVEGLKLGRELGFPTANLDYPNAIVKLPYGVYKVLADNKLAIANWGIKPTIDGKKEVLEVHILNFNEDLYGKELKVEFLEYIRAEKKFSTLEDLKSQIKKDIELCLR